MLQIGTRVPNFENFDKQEIIIDTVGKVGIKNHTAQPLKQAKYAYLMSYNTFLSFR